MMQRSDFPALETDRPVGSVSDGAASATGIRKRAVRIAVSLPVEIRDQFGGQDQTRTQFVLLRGCLLNTALPVRVGNKLTLHNIKSGRTAECHAIGVEHGLNSSHQIEVEFTSAQPEFWPVQFPAEESRTSNPSHAPQDPKTRPERAVSDKDLLVLADSVAHDFSSRPHSRERGAANLASADSVAQFRAANRAAHRREQRRKAIYSALFFAALSGSAVGARYWFTHKPQLLEAAPAPELRSMAQKIARAIPAKTANAAQASAVESASPSETTAASDLESQAQTTGSRPTITSGPPVSSVMNQSFPEPMPQPAADAALSDTQVAVRHGSTTASMRKTAEPGEGEEPVALPLDVAETATLAKPEALKDVVAGVPARTAVLAVQVPRKAVPARLIHSVPAQYPPMARQLHVEGEVMLNVNVDANGAVTDVKVVSGPPLLRAAATDCVTRWRYQPATLGDKPVPSTEVVRVDFHSR